MNASEDILVVPGPVTSETWRAQGKESSSPQDSSKAKSAGWVALPMRSVISVPMRFPSMAADRREAAAMLELEGLGIHASENDFQVETRDADAREQRAWAVVQSNHIPAQAQQATMDAKFAPSVAFRSLKPGRLDVWEENGHLAIAIPDESGKPLHSQALSSDLLDEDAAAEIRCVLCSMELLGITAELTELLFVHKDVAPAPDALAAFGQAVGLSVSTAPAPPPAFAKRRLEAGTTSNRGAQASSSPAAVCHPHWCWCDIGSHGLARRLRRPPLEP